MIKSQSENGSKYEIASFCDLQEGKNNGKVVSCKVTNTISKKGEVPAKFACVDFKSSFAGLSIYHINDEIYDSIHDQTEIYVADPKVKTIKLQLGPENIISYMSIQVQEPDKIYIDSQKVQNVFSPS
mmetsp:Transcript_3743/g.3177  ORF Transcript_3743/g.3177 Transcript_3743/m.3177 type:complete len:127 (+) Transcript_3743:845-1225(+)